MGGEMGDSRLDLKSSKPDPKPLKLDYLLPAAAPLFKFLSPPPSPYAGFQDEETP
jgi:hypothetical protein